MLSAQSVAWERAKSMGKGMNFSWMENWWNGSQSLNYSNYLDLNRLPSLKGELMVMKAIGVQTLRLPVVFDVWEDGQAPYTFERTEYFEVIDSLVAWATELDFKLIIDYQHGSLNATNHNTEALRIAEHWKQIARRYKDSDPDRIFYELYNEPHDISKATWQAVAQTIVDAIRSVDTEHTLIVGGIFWNGIDGLWDLRPFADDNIIYTFHFYEPFIFTHQGAEWVGAPVATTGIPYPHGSSPMPPLNWAAQSTWGANAYNDYATLGQIDALYDQLALAKMWSMTKNLPILCGEFGAYYKAGIENRCRHTTDVRSILEEMEIPYCYWEWDQGFSIFEGRPDLDNLPECMQEAWGDPLVSSLTDERLLRQKMLLFPNPTPGLINLYGNEERHYDQLRVISSNGQVLQNRTLQGGAETVDLSAFPKGMYVLQFLDLDDGEVMNRKVVKY